MMTSTIDIEFRVDVLFFPVHCPLSHAIMGVDVGKTDAQSRFSMTTALCFSFCCTLCGQQIGLVPPLGVVRALRPSLWRCSSSSGASSTRRAFLAESATSTTATVADFAFGSQNKKTVRGMTSVSTTTEKDGTAGGGYWNRELSGRQAYDRSAPVVRKARILCLGDPKDPANELLYSYKQDDPDVQIVAIASTKDEIETANWGSSQQQRQYPNVLFVSAFSDARDVLVKVLSEDWARESIEWIHARSAGIDFIASPALSGFDGIVTNAKGSFSSTLAEYAML